MLYQTLHFFHPTATLHYSSYQVKGTDTCFTAADIKLYMKINYCIGKTHASRATRPLPLRTLITLLAWHSPMHHQHTTSSRDQGKKGWDSLLLAATHKARLGGIFSTSSKPAPKLWFIRCLVPFFSGRHLQSRCFLLAQQKNPFVHQTGSRVFAFILGK